MVLYPGTYLDDEVPRPTAATDAGWSTPRTSTSTRSSASWSPPTATGSTSSGSTSGDPSVYSALAEQTRRLDAAGVPWDVTPGVPAYAAAAALVGRELTVPLVAQSVVLTRAQARSTAMPETESLAALRGDPAPRWCCTSRSPAPAS